MNGGRWLLRLTLCLVMLSAGANAIAQSAEFPFDGELRLDAKPMPGSKRVPVLEVATNGAMVLELWCNRVEGLVVIAADTITVLTNPPPEKQCAPAQAAADADLIAALTDVTNWRRQGDIVLLVGKKTLRFSVPTN
jgi:hypothetical protein